MLRLTVDPGDPQRLVALPGHEACSLLADQQPGRSLLDVDAAHGGASRADPMERRITWTGSYAVLEGGGLFTRDPRTWGPRGWEALEEACQRVARVDACVYVVRPHAVHVLSDLPGIRRFASRIAGAYPGRFALLLDPMSMLDGEHFDRGTASETLRRIAEALPALATPELPLAGVVVANARRTGSGVALTGIDGGELDARVIRGLFGVA